MPLMCVRPITLWIPITVNYLLLLILLAGLTGCTPRSTANLYARTDSSDEPRGTSYDPPKELADFSLMSHTGKPIRLSALRGLPVLLFFGYTHCPDVCPLTLKEWTKVKQQLGADADKVAFVFVSVDGARDKPDVLANYIRSYDPSFIGLTGDEGMVRAIAKDFGGYFNLPGDGAEASMVEHGTYSFLVNPQGQLQMVYAYGMPADVISKDLRVIVQGS